MTDSPYTPAIAHLADVAGVTTDWTDAWGGEQQVAEDDLVAVLSALTGSGLDSEREIRRVADEILASRPTIEPVIVAWDGIFPATSVGRSQHGHIVLEDDSHVAVAIDGGRATVRRALPIGYHRLVIDDDPVAHVFSAPMRAHPTPKGVLGIVSPTYSLRRNSPDIGVGTIGDLRALADLASESGVAVVGTLPMLAAFPDEPSPYAPASRRAWNEIFVDLERLPGWESTLPAASGDPGWVDYENAGEAVRARLADYAEFVTGTSLRRDVDAYLEREPEMVRYAAFRALTDVHGRNWRAWPSGLEPDPIRRRYHETVQWIADRQLRRLSDDLAARGQYLYLDLPIGCHPDGYDIWDRPEQFAPASLGAPPDPLFVGGQDWGLPATIPALAREDGHVNFRKAIARQLSVAGLLRIDHVMGIHRTWWVPHGSTATQGAYVAQPTEEMFAIICIESMRADAGVVGENLGTVPPEIHAGLADHGLLGMAVALDGVTEPKPTDLVALTSHDTPAFPAWWKGLDIDDLLDLGVFDDERATRERAERAAAVEHLQETFETDGVADTRDALIAWMAGTEAAVALINLDDLLMEERRQNIPGTYWERPNWRLRNSRSIDDLGSDGRFTSRLAGFVDRRSPRGAVD